MDWSHFEWRPISRASAWHTVDDVIVYVYVRVLPLEKLAARASPSHHARGGTREDLVGTAGQASKPKHTRSHLLAQTHTQASGVGWGKG